MTDNSALDVGSNQPGRYGAPALGATLREVALGASWNVQGDAERATFAAEVEQRFGVSLPTASNTTSQGADWTAFWTGPTSWLLMARRPRADVDPARAFQVARGALNSHGGALFDVSAARIAFHVSGAYAAAVLARLCPVDLDVSVFAAGRCVQTLLGHVNGLIFRVQAGPEFVVWVPRSLRRDAWRALCVSAAPAGYEVCPALAFGEVGTPLTS